MAAKKIVTKPKPEVKITAAPRRVSAKKRQTAAARKQPARKSETVTVPPVEKKPAKQRKRLIRDSFTMPEPDFALIAALKLRTLAARRETKKSELLRAGLHALMALDDDTLVNALGRLQPLKLGRPKKAH